jgi:tape measure domain-containing protein
MADEVTVIVNAVLNNEKFKKGLKDTKTNAEKTNKGIFATVSKLKGAYLAVAAVVGGVVITAFKNLITLTARLEAQGKAFSTVFGRDAKDAMKFVKEEAKRLGLEIETASKGFVKISAAAKGTSLEGEGVREVFSGVAEAATALQLNSEQTAGALTALEQIISKGKVQAEELRGQLGERLPGAFQIAARAMGVTTKELDKLMSTGKITAEDFIPKFATQLRKEFGGAAADAAKSFQAASNRLSNALKAVARVVGTVLLPPLTMLLTKLTEIIEPVSKITTRIIKFNTQFRISERILLTYIFAFKTLINLFKVSFGQGIRVLLNGIKFMSKVFKETLMGMISDVKSFGKFFKDVFTGKGIKKSFENLTESLNANAKKWVENNKENAKQFGADFIAPYVDIIEDTTKFVEDMSKKADELAEDRKVAADKGAKAEEDATERVKITAQDRIEFLKFIGKDEEARLLELETKKAELIKKFADDRVAIEEATNAQIKAIRANNAASTLSEIQDVASQISDITQSFFDNEIEKAQNKASKEENILRQQKTDGIITEEEFNAKKEELDKKAAREEAKIRQKAAIAARVGGLFDVALNTSVGIAKSVASSPLTGGLPWSAIIAGIGVAQAGAILAKPLPEVPGFAGGVRNFSGGMARINEQGGELVNLPSGANVLTNAATKDLLFNGGGRSQVSNISSTTNNDNSQRNFTFNGIRDIGAARNQLIRTEGKGAFL